MGVEEPEKKEGTGWILQAFIASLCYTVSNGLKARMSREVDFIALLYNGLGCILAPIIFFLWNSAASYRSGGRFWDDQNIIVGGKFSLRNFIAMVVFTFINLGVVSFATLTLYTSTRTVLNAGVVSSIWSLTPFVMAIGDYIFFGIKITISQVYGMLLIVVCVILLGLKDVIEEKRTGVVAPKLAIDDPLPTYIPVIVAGLSPIIFTASGMMGKHMT